MKNNRREFLKQLGMAGLTLPTLGLVGNKQKEEEEPFRQTKPQRFNMHGYAAPALDTVRIGIIGLGNRGSGTVSRLSSIEGVEINALCDLEEDRVKKAQASLEGTSHNPDGYFGDDQEWKKVCEREDIDLISIVTPWEWHTPMAVYAMEHDKHAYTELPAAQTIDECWQLVETSEKTRKHCVQISASCHESSRATLLNMARKGFFGDIIHAEGAYIHDLLERYNFDKTMYHDNWRLKENLNRNGCLYPQHGLGPAAQMLDLNYGDQMDYMVSMSSNDFMMGKKAKELAEEDEFWEPFTGWDYRGNINTTTIRTHKGRTLVIQHDVSSPRPNVRFDLLSGTEGTYKAGPGRLSTSHDGWLSEEEYDSLMEEYMPPIVKRFNELMSEAESGQAEHSYYNVDLRDWRLIDCLRNGLPVEMDVYDAALWSSVIPLSEWSVANGSKPVNVPDFTGGAWKTNERGMDIELNKGGGTTRII